MLMLKSAKVESVLAAVVRGLKETSAESIAFGIRAERCNNLKAVDILTRLQERVVVAENVAQVVCCD
jgi:hypothetical protein